jgi:hypothetical protein
MNGSHKLRVLHGMAAALSEYPCCAVLHGASIQHNVTTSDVCLPAAAAAAAAAAAV